LDFQAINKEVSGDRLFFISLTELGQITRFRPITPLALPHATTADEYYDGYLIPKGATLFINCCAC
jgi:hypothetical protein